MSSKEIFKQFKDQDFNRLKAAHNASRLFEDPLFPPTSSSLYHTKIPPQGIIWKRPKEAVNNPKFEIDGFHRVDMDQGYLGNCWFIAACVDIVQSPKLFARVVPYDQSFDTNYAGIFHFRFWVYGEWIDIVVDDRLPYWPDGRLVFASNKEQVDEYWSPLLEKAYAKLYGSYENLEAGQTFDALIDMSGGIQEQFDLKTLGSSDQAKFWTYLEKGFQNGALLGCSINPDPRIKEARLRNGLVRGHAYSITSVKSVKGNKLIRVRNPWGNEIEWKGAWSDNSSEWSSLNASERSGLEFNRAADGEFWMCLSDFMSSWDQVQMCHLSGESFSNELEQTDKDSDLKWNCKSYQSKWQSGVSGGGSGQKNQAKFWTNPQFLIKLTDVDHDDNENLATVIVSLMQKDTRIKRIRTKQDSCEEFIQFRLFRIKSDVSVDQSDTNGLKLYSSQMDRVGTSGSYINSRDVTKRFRVPPGNYLIIPSTYDENKNCEFMLRIFTQELIEGKPLEHDKNNLDEDDVHFVPEQEDLSRKHWTNILNPKVFKKVTNIGKQILNEYNRMKNDGGAIDFNAVINIAKESIDVINNDLGGINLDKVAGGLNKLFSKK